MKQLLNLNTFVKILTDKGYSGYFLTAAGYPDKLKDSITQFLDACEDSTDKPILPNILLLKTYLQWNGDDKPKIECNLWVSYENGTFDVQKMDIERIDRYGQLLKKSELTNLSTRSVPTVKEAIVQVSETPKEQTVFRKRGFRM